MPKSKRHTKPCLYFQTNDCPLSADECDFAHVIATQEEYESLKNPQATLRTKPCRFYLGGQCRDGYWCRFKHPAGSFTASRGLDTSLLEDVPELDSDKSTDEDVDVREIDGAWKAKPEEHPKYRTRPCRNFILGKCVYGDRCSYMHVLAAAETSTDCAAATPIANTLVAPSSLFPKATSPRPSTNCNVGGSQNSDSDVDTLDLDSSSSSTPARVLSYQNIQTPSTSSLLTDEHDAPAVPASAINTEYPPSMRRVPSFPMPPFSPLPYPLHEYAPKSLLDCPPLASPFPMYSPTSPLPLQIVHVPFAFPMYQDLSSAQMRPTANAQEKQPPRQHAFSQPNGDVGAISLPSPQYRSKPCKFFNEPGRCHKGNRCNFSHASVPLTVPRRSTQPTRKETKTPEQTPRKPSENSEDQTPSNEPERAKSSNFYKINWRVVGGGVKIGTDNSVLRRRSEDMSGSAGCLPSFRNPFNPSNERLSIITSPLPPAAELRGRSHSLITVSTSKTSSFSSRKGSADNALTLSLKTIRLSETETSDETEPSNDTSQPQPIVVVQGEDEEDADGRKSEKDADNTKLPFPEGGEKKFVFTSRQDTTRAKSSPSSPVAMYSDLSNKVFAAESP